MDRQDWTLQLLELGVYRVTREGGIFSGKSGKAIRPVSGPGGYVVLVVNHLGIKAQAYWHRVVWNAFNGKIPLGLFVNHRDGNKENNSLDNLELVTATENMRHAQRVLGFKPGNPKIREQRRGSGNGRTSLKETDVLRMMDLYVDGRSVKELSEEFSVSTSVVRKIISGKSWKHV